MFNNNIYFIHKIYMFSEDINFMDTYVSSQLKKEREEKQKLKNIIINTKLLIILLENEDLSKESRDKISILNDLLN